MHSIPVAGGKGFHVVAKAIHDCHHVQIVSFVAAIDVIPALLQQKDQGVGAHHLTGLPQQIQRMKRMRRRAKDHPVVPDGSARASEAQRLRETLESVVPAPSALAESSCVPFDPSAAVDSDLLLTLRDPGTPRKPG